VPPHALTANDEKVDDGGMAEENMQEQVKEQESEEIVTTTRSGRSVRVPSYLRENYETSTAAEEKYYAAIASMEFGFVYADGVEEMMVGAGVGGGFVNSKSCTRSNTRKPWHRKIG
jgi:hypothetical protein